MKSEIATVIFDCGQVITHRQNKDIARAMADLLGIHGRISPGLTYRCGVNTTGAAWTP
jgi:hypothetical protein